MSPEVAKKLGARIGEEKFKKQSSASFYSKTEFKVDDASVILVSRENRSIVGKKEITRCYDCPRGRFL